MLSTRMPCTLDESYTAAWRCIRNSLCSGPKGLTGPRGTLRFSHGLWQVSGAITGFAAVKINERMELGSFPWDMLLQELTIPLTIPIVFNSSSTREYAPGQCFTSPNFPPIDVFKFTTWILRSPTQALRRGILWARLSKFTSCILGVPFEFTCAGKGDTIYQMSSRSRSWSRSRSRGIYFGNVF